MRPRKVISLLLSLFQFILFLKLIEYVSGHPTGENERNSRQISLGIGPYVNFKKRTPLKAPTTTTRTTTTEKSTTLFQNSTFSSLEIGNFSTFERNNNGVGVMKQIGNLNIMDKLAEFLSGGGGNDDPTFQTGISAVSTVPKPSTPIKNDVANVLVSTLPLMSLYLIIYMKIIGFTIFLYIWKVLFYPVDDPYAVPQSESKIKNNFGQKIRTKGPPSIFYNKFVSGLLHTFGYGRSMEDIDFFTKLLMAIDKYDLI